MDLMMTEKQEVLEKLAKYYPFFEPALRDEIAVNARIRQFKTGDILMKPGQYFKSTMLITKGMVKVYKEGEDGGELFMYYLEPGNACALSMICAAKQEQSELLAIAIEDTEVIMIPVTLMDDLMLKFRSWYYFVLATYRTRFEELLNLVNHTVFKGLDERLEFYLRKQREVFKSEEVRITHEEIARDLGTSRVVISRLLKVMEQQGKVKLNRNAIILKNIPL